MRNILLAFLLSWVICDTFGQVQYLGSPTTTVRNRGNFVSDSLFYLPKRQKAPSDTGAIRYAISDSSVYVWTGYQWNKLAPGAFVAISDTASMLSPYIRAAGYGLLKSSQTLRVDTTLITTRERLQYFIDSSNLIEKIGGSGTVNYIPKFTATRAISNSLISSTTNAVGIGIAAPEWFLHAKTSSFLTTFLGENTSNDTGYIGMKNQSGAVFLGSIGNDAIISTTLTFSEKIRIKNDGNVGIGTSSPNAKLDVSGNIYFGGSGNVTQTFQGNGTNTTFYNSKASLYINIDTDDNGANDAIAFGRNRTGDSGGNTDMYLNEGELRIGTTTDAGAYALQVTGAIYNTTTLTTGAPTSGTAKPWRLGEAATVSPTSPNRTIRVEIDGTVYYLHAKTTND